MPDLLAPPDPRGTRRLSRANVAEPDRSGRQSRKRWKWGAAAMAEMVPRNRAAREGGRRAAASR